MRALLAIALVACGGEPARPAVIGNASPGQPKAGLEVTLERTTCFGNCPAYTVTIHADGMVAWIGADYVRTKGERHHRIGARQLDELADVIARAHVEEYDANARHKEKCSDLAADGHCRTLYMDCTDTTHARVSIKRGTELHEYDNGHCTDSPLEALEDAIDRIAGTADWIGGLN